MTDGLWGMPATLGGEGLREKSLKKLAFPEPFEHNHPPVRELSEMDLGPATWGNWVYKNVGSWRFIMVNLKKIKPQLTLAQLQSYRRML